ncbi:MAG: hypothetical protein ACR2JH_04245, partial [Solirubrobacteraceae bacterium]
MPATISKREIRRSLPPGPSVPGALQMLATWKRPAASLERMGSRSGQHITAPLPSPPPPLIPPPPHTTKK